ncbi:ankyrin repeat protein [Seminavis robusta]|uniref:Ankyrin repeat protein n=1 Tax=Seminavis robusta TaxID=568900 RepID=A0A9N8HZC5_9STRA|nr:ankyrin repeat protein [Seminavis robusta]|eukprot:Sro3429_g347940.1 ankyrin repeat protein (254) ;mRNA; f:4709-5470
MASPPSPLLNADDLIWTNKLLSFVGVGQHAFVGAANKRFNKLYKEYCEKELQKNPRKVTDTPGHPDRGTRSAEITDTFCSEAFCNESRAEHWLRDTSPHKKPRRHLVCRVLAKTGNPTVMQWARKKGLPWSRRTCAAAAAHGHLHLLQWLRENDYPWDERTCSDAALFGHLDILKWAHENGCPWDHSTCEAAAQGGHLDVLKWARENGCPWDHSTCKAAANGGHLDGCAEVGPRKCLPMGSLHMRGCCQRRSP